LTATYYIRYTTSSAIPVYHHPTDRRRLFRALVASERARKGATQVEVARRARVSQSLVSRLEASETKRVCRNLLTRILAFGLELGPTDVEALAWLYQGALAGKQEDHPLAAEHPPNSEARVHAEPGSDFRTSILRLLSRAVHQPGSLIHDATARVTFSSDEVARLEQMREVLRIEKREGLRLLVTKYPSSLTNPPEAFASGKVQPQFIFPDSRKIAIEIMLERQQVFISNLQTYGERNIHSKQGLKRFLTEETGFRYPLEQRRAQVRHWVHLLAQYPQYEVALVEATPQLEIGIKSTLAAVVRGAPRDDDQAKTALWGPYQIFWHDKHSVLSFLLEFETRWDAIPPEGRRKPQVLAWLRHQLEMRP